VLTVNFSAEPVHAPKPKSAPKPPQQFTLVDANRKRVRYGFIFGAFFGFVFANSVMSFFGSLVARPRKSRDCSDASSLAALVRMVLKVP
jgi:hypothetical protein